MKQNPHNMNDDEKEARQLMAKHSMKAKH